MYKSDFYENAWDRSVRDVSALIKGIATWALDNIIVPKARNLCLMPWDGRIDRAEMQLETIIITGSIVTNTRLL